MRLRKSTHPLTPEEIQERNIQRNRERIFNHPKPSLWDRFMTQLFEVEKWWRRHVTQRRFYRALDGTRLVERQDWGDPAVMLQRLRGDWNSYPDYYPWGDDDERP